MARSTETEARPDPDEARELHRAVGAWYREHRRALPWRERRDAYAIWISEAMLQQTRVETVVDYWRRFLERLPTVGELAGADESVVLELWSGLGYYRRARSLQAAARVIVERHGGEFPRTLAEALALPGVGPYTAGAVLSIAFDSPEPVVDGNVERVFARWFGVEGDVRSTAVKKRMWALARALVPERGAGDWNQALMELGATTCTPREPKCLLCPASERCTARLEGRISELPTPKQRTEPVQVDAVIALVRDGGRLLLERRPEGGRMAGLWQFPTIEVTDAEPLLFPAELPGGSSWIELGPRIGELRHSITRHRVKAAVHSGRARDVGPTPERCAWLEQAEIGDLPRTGMTAKVLRAGWVGTAE